MSPEGFLDTAKELIGQEIKDNVEKGKKYADKVTNVPKKAAGNLSSFLIQLSSRYGEVLTESGIIVVKSPGLITRIKGEAPKVI